MSPPPPPPPPPTAVLTTDVPASSSDHRHPHVDQATAQIPLNDAWTAWSSSLSSRALDPLAAAATDLADFASRHREAALSATSDVQLAKIHAQAEQCATQALLTISEYLHRATAALDTGAIKCGSELQVLSAMLAAIEQRVIESFAVSTIQSLGTDALKGEKEHGKVFVDFANEEAVKIIKQPDISSAASTKFGRSNSHVPGLPFQSHGPSSATSASTAPTSSIPILPKLDLTSLDSLGTPLPDLSTLVPKAGSIKQQSLLSTSSASPPPMTGSGSTTAANANNLDLSMLGDVSQHTTIRRKSSNVSATTGATTDSSLPAGAPPALSSAVGMSIDDLSPPPPPPPGAPPVMPVTTLASSPPPTDPVTIPTQQIQTPPDPRGSVRCASGMVPTQQPPPQPQLASGGSVRSMQGISAPVPLYASHQPPQPQYQQQQQPYNVQYTNTQRVPSPGSHMGTYTGGGGGGSVRGQPIGLGSGVNGGYGVPPMPMPPVQYAAAGVVVPPRGASSSPAATPGMQYATSAVAPGGGYPPGGPNGSIGYGFASLQQGYPMQQHVPQPGGPGSRYASVNQLPPQQPFAVDPATGAPMYYAPLPTGGSNSTSPQMAPAPPPPMGVSPPPPHAQPVPLMARVLYPYTASEADEMHLIPGEVIEVLVLDAGAGWAKGVSITDRRRVGMFPRSYVQLL